MSVGVATSQVDDTSVSKGVDRHRAAPHRFGLYDIYVFKVQSMSTKLITPEKTESVFISQNESHTKSKSRKSMRNSQVDHIVRV